MKNLLLFVFCILITCDVFAQDTTRIDSGCTTSLTIQPIFGLGLLNGGRVGLSVKLNEIVAVEAAVGLEIRATAALVFFFLPLPISLEGRAVSEGIIFTPFEEKRLSFILYNTNLTYKELSLNVWQAMVGWKMQTGESTALRMSAGYAQKYNGRWNDFDDIMVGLDFVLTIGDYKVLL